MKFEYFKLAVGNLSHRKTRSILTMIGIFIGIAAIISLISLGQGLQTAVSAQFSALGSDRLIIQAKGGSFGPPGQDSAAKLTKDDLAVLQKTQYVKSAAGRLMAPSVATFNKKTNPVFLASFPDDNERERQLVVEISKLKVAQGRFLTASDKNKIMIGNIYATDTTYGTVLQVGDKLVISNVSVEVVGILASTGNPGTDHTFFINEAPLRKLVNEPTSYSVLTAQTDSDAVVNLAADAATRDLRRHRGLRIRQEDFTVQTSAQLLESVDKILNVIQAVLVGIAAISLIVGGIGIMNTMYTSVLERTKEIGIMKAIGATNGTVLTIFLIEAGVLGIIGGAVGIGIGIGMAKLVEFIGTFVLGTGLLQANISLDLVIGALIFSLIVGIVSGLMPALQASKMEPAEALSGG